jgi:hypothetical protein
MSRGTIGADDGVLDDEPYTLAKGKPQIRYPRDKVTDHAHIWVPGRPDRYVAAQDDAGAPYSVAHCVNCPAYRVERVGDAGEPMPERPAHVAPSET